MTEEINEISLGDIELQIPDANTPGHWQRQEQVTDLQITYHDAKKAINEAQKTEDEDSIVEAMRQLRSAQRATVDYIVGFISSPADPEKARAAFKMLSENQVNKVLERIREGSGDAGNPTSADGSESE